MKFTTFAVLSCVVASAAALPAPGTNGDLATRGLRQKAHDIHQIWKDASTQEDQLEDQEDAIEHARNQKIKAVIFGHADTNAANKPAKRWIHPFDAIKSAWRNEQEEDAFEKANKAEVKKLKATDRQAAKALKKENEIKEDALESKHRGETWAVFRGKKTEAQKAAAAAEKNGQEIGKRTIGESWTTWRQTSGEEDTLEKKHKEQLKKLDEQRKELLAEQKAEMKALKAKNWTATKAAFWNKGEKKAAEAPTQVKTQVIDESEH